MKVVDKFEYWCGYKFLIYVIWWIWQVIMCLIVDQVCMICILVYMIEMINKLVCIGCQMLYEIGCEFMFEELVEKLQMLLEKVCKVMKIVKELILLEILIGDEEDSQFGDFIEDKNVVLFLDSVIQENFKEIMMWVLVSLILCEECVLWMWFGIGMNIDYMFEEVGQQFSVICECICQIEVKVLCKLKYLLWLCKLWLFFD